MKAVFAGGGTGGHVIPALAVAREWQTRGHEAVFIGTHTGMEAKLVPAAGFEIQWIEISGFQGVGLKKKLTTLPRIPRSVVKSAGILRRIGADVVFSMGGYVAAPVMMAALLMKIPMVVMEPNAMPGLTSRRMGRWASRALVSFREAEPFFRPGRTEVTGLPVRQEFFEVVPKVRTETLTVLITGGSQGSRTLNMAVQQAWPKFKEAGVRVIHQAGVNSAEEISKAFARSGVEGRVVAFLNDMPAAYAEADLIVSRSGAGAVAELAAAGKPSILVPFPFAADDHQLRNAEAFARAGAAKLVLDKDLSADRLFKEVMMLAGSPGVLEEMARAANALAKPGSAKRAADILEDIAAKKAHAGKA
ncbi:MAG: undecaprenyldiphospho-muramoylpentapeptide beta-N-acetylglucosaminyltransferase [Bryobacteraceae bacterium]